MTKQELIFKWLKAGYSISRIGQMHTAIVKDGKLIRYTHFGSSAVNANKSDLKYLLTEIFDEDDEFYIIGNDGYIRTTNSLIDITTEKEYTFTLYARNIWTQQETPLKQYTMRLSEMVSSYYDVAEKYSKDHPEQNLVHFAISCENPFFRYWNFAI